MCVFVCVHVHVCACVRSQPDVKGVAITPRFGDSSCSSWRLNVKGESSLSEPGVKGETLHKCRTFWEGVVKYRNSHGDVWPPEIWMAFSSVHSQRSRLSNDHFGLCRLGI